MAWGNAATAAQEAEKIVLLHYWSGALRGGIDDTAAAFNAQHPRYNLKATGFEHESFKVGIRAMLDSGQPPDIFSYWAGARLESLAAADQIELIGVLAQALQPGGQLVLRNPNPDSVVGLPVTLDQAGVRVTAAPVPVIRPFASTVKGVMAVVPLL